MRRKFIAAVTSGVLALTVMAALPTHAEAVSIWLDRTPGTESVETVCLLSKLNAKQHIEVDIHMDELDLTDA
ncbi:MAG: hypothetical protein ACLUQG_01505, partial [Faecalibacterium prausnitzii]